MCFTKTSADLSPVSISPLLSQKILLSPSPSKAIPTLIAEGYAKKYQQRGFQKYLQDAMAESNEMIVHLSFTKDMKHPEQSLCDKLNNDELEEE